MKNKLVMALAAPLLLLFAACGGGGGGATASSSTPSVSNNWLSFSPSSVNIQASAGASVPFTLTATSSKTLTPNFNIGIIDAKGVIQPNASIMENNPYSYSATLHTSSQLVAGTYTGTLEVRLCYGDPTTNQDPVEGSPWYVPYSIQVTSTTPAMVVGHTYTGSTNSGLSSYVDLTSISTSVNGNTVRAVFTLRGIPEQMAFHQTGIPTYYSEYSWEIGFDTDGSPATGDSINGPLRGCDYAMATRVYMPAGTVSPVTLPLASLTEGVTSEVEVATTSGWSKIGSATLTVDTVNGTLTLEGSIPGIQPNTRIAVKTYEYSPQGQVTGDTITP